MAVRWFWILSLYLFAVGVVLGDGTYQRTKDGKTIVWNADPKPGDSASWAGDRDADGYATKVGTLTWYTTRGTVYARFRGNMVRGKFNGMVTGYSKSKYAHALFVAGERTTRWVGGQARASQVAQTEMPPEPPKISGDKKTDRGTVEYQTASASAERLASPPVSPKHHQSAAERLLNQANSEQDREKTRPNVSTIEPSTLPGNFTPDVQTDSDQKHQGLTASTSSQISSEPTASAAPVPSTDDSPATDYFNNDEPEPPTEGPQVEIAEGPAATASPAAATTQPMEEKPTAPEEAAANAPANNDKPDEAAESMPPATSSNATLEAPGSSEAKPRLTNEQVILLANTELLEKGYNRLNYTRQEPQFDADHGAWSVGYDPMTSDGVKTPGPHLNVVIDDRTRGAVFLLKK